MTKESRFQKCMIYGDNLRDYEEWVRQRDVPSLKSKNSICSALRSHPSNTWALVVYGNETRWRCLCTDASKYRGGGGVDQYIVHVVAEGHNMHCGPNKKLSYCKDSVRRSRSLKVTDFDTDRKPVLVNNTSRNFFQLSCTISRNIAFGEGCLSLTNQFSVISSNIAIYCQN